MGGYEPSVTDIERFDTEGENYMRTRFAVDKETKKVAKAISKRWLTKEDALHIRDGVRSKSGP